MKYLKFIIINIIVFGLAFFLLTLLFPNTVNTNKAITIIASKEKVYNTLQSLHDWEKWNKFATSEEITIKPDFANEDTISTKWKLKNGQAVTSYHHLISMSKDSTVVDWVLQKKYKWYQPFDKFASMFTDKQTGRIMEISLDHLKKQLESITDSLSLEN